MITQTISTKQRGKHRVLSLAFLFLLTACSASSTKTSHTGDNNGSMASPIQCVPFVRELSGIEIYGNAYTWWDSAVRQGYQRGNVPQLNAVLVLKKSARLANGHVAMVRRIVGPRRIELTHANWGMEESTRRLVHDSMPAIDVSPNNDWTQVKLFNEQAGVFGQPYAAWGFIYPKDVPPG